MTARQAAVTAPHYTPDRRYIVVKQRLWRAANPQLAPSMRSDLQHQLMEARRAVKAALRANDAGLLAQARQSVDAAKRALGERGPVWWSDGAPDYNRHLVRNTPYAAWYAQMQERQ